MPSFRTYALDLTLLALGHVDGHMLASGAPASRHVAQAVANLERGLVALQLPKCRTPAYEYAQLASCCLKNEGLKTAPLRDAQQCAAAVSVSRWRRRRLAAYLPRSSTAREARRAPLRTTARTEFCSLA